MSQDRESAGKGDRTKSKGDHAELHVRIRVLEASSERCRRRDGKLQLADNPFYVTLR